MAVDVDIPVAREQAELARVLASTTFHRAARLCTLLSYVVEHSLAMELDELTEQQIGMHVFGRSPGYNSAEDTIVRGTARLLRLRLDQYYSDEGRHDPLRITIPKGSYVAHFEELPTEQGPVAAAVVPAPPTAGAAAPARWPHSARLVLSALLVCLAVMGGVLSIMLLRHPKPPASVLTGPQPLWNALFTPGRRTLLVPGDAALDAFVAWEQRPVSLAEYSQQSYVAETHASRPPNDNDVPLATRSVTPMADLRLVSELVRVPEHMNRPDLEPWVEVRYARDVAVGDTHDNNLVLIGSETFNPWVTLYANSMDFHAQWDYRTDVYSIVNRATRPGEASRYEYVRTAHTPPSLAYTHLAFLDNTQGSGKVLIIEGTSMGSTYAALAFLTQQQLWQPVMQAATDKAGRLHNFEVLLGSEFVRGGLTNTRQIALHVH